MSSHQVTSHVVTSDYISILAFQRLNKTVHRNNFDHDKMENDQGLALKHFHGQA